MNKKTVFIDTNIFIYFFQGNIGQDEAQKARKFFEQLSSGKVTGVTSVITQLELLSLPATNEENQQLLELFLETPNLKVVSVDAEIVNEAAKIRRKYGYKTPDAIQLATAVVCKVDAFLTNDRQLEKFTEITVTLL